MKYHLITFIIVAICSAIGVQLTKKGIAEDALHQHCGKILFKLEEELHHKYSVSYSPTFVVDFGNGKIWDISVTNYTYLTKSAGDTICFQLTDRFINEGYGPSLKMLGASVFWVVLAVFVIVRILWSL